MDDEDSRRAQTLYKRTLALFRPRADNVVTLPVRSQTLRFPKTTELATPSPEPLYQSREQNAGQEQSRGLEGLLKQLFEEIAKDE